MTLPSTSLCGREFERILLIKLSAMGDVVQTMPVLNKLRRRYPAARLDWLTTPPFAEFLRQNHKISNVLEFARDEWRQPWRLGPLADAARLAAKLRDLRYDLVLDLQGQFRSAVFARATAAAVRIGFARPHPRAWRASSRNLPEEARKHAWQGAREASWLAYTHPIKLPTLDLHAVDRYLGVVPMLGLDEDPADFSFPISPTARERIEALLQRHGIAASTKLLVMAPGANWETKRWHNEGFAAVARHFLQRRYGVALIGAPSERALCAQIARRAPGSMNLAGETTLSELAALIRRAALCVTNDSGPTHLAVALDRSVISIFGPTDPVWAGPYHRADAVVRAELACAPCYLRRLSRCRHAHACMQEISPRAVIEQVEKLLADNTVMLATST